MSVFVVEKQDGTIEYPLAAINIRRMFPNVSFPKAMGSYTNPDLGIYLFVRTDPPESEYSHVNQMVDPIKNGGEYIQQWGPSTPRPQSEIDIFYDNVVDMVKRYAERLIVERYPDWKQRNMITRSITLQNISPRTDDEQAELASISVAWDWIDAIRMASDSLEQDLLQMGIAAAMEYDISSYPNWPE